MSTGGQGIKCRRNIAENFNRLSRAHEHYRRQTDRRQTDGQATAYSKRERLNVSSRSLKISTQSISDVLYTARVERVVISRKQWKIQTSLL